MFTGEPNKKQYTAGDIQRYHSGLMSPAERNALEKAALEDPFLEEALEGYALHPSATQDMPLLNARLDERVNAPLDERVNAPLDERVNAPLDERVRKRRTFVVFMRTWGAAAAVLVLVLLGGGIFIRYLGRHSKESPIAAKQAPAQVAPQPAVGVPQPAVGVPQPAVGVPQPTVGVPDASDSVVLVVPKPHPKTPQTFRNREYLIAPQAETFANDRRTSADSSQRRPIGDSTEALQAAIASAPRSGVASAPPVGIASAPPVGVASAPPAEVFKKIQGMTVDTLDNIFSNRIIDNQYQPIPFASIRPLKSKFGVVSDTNGYFKLRLSDTNVLVRVSAVGYATREVNIYQKTPIQLDQIHTSLDEVVMTSVDRKSFAEEKRANGPYHAIADSSNLEPIDGWDNYTAYLSSNLHLPGEVLRKNIHGDVALSFQLDKEGNPIHVNVDQSLCNDCDAEAKRLLLQGPHWKKKGKGRRGRLRIHF